MEQAIAAYEEALQVATRKARPNLWADITVHLAAAYSNRIAGVRADNIERAIEGFHAALEVLTREALPLNWAQTMHNLASAYVERIRGDRADNIERAIEGFHAALEVLTREARPSWWAQTMDSLAVAYRQRIRGEPEDNLEEAIKLYGQALEVRTYEAMPSGWAQTTHNLAAAYSRRVRGVRAENLEKAIELYEQALRVFTRDARRGPFAWARTVRNCADTYRERIRGDPAENLERAIEGYEQVLQVFTRKVMPWQWATTEMNLASAYRERIRGDPAENVERAITGYEQALQFFSIDAFPREHRLAQRDLGHFHFGEGSWAPAHVAYSAALEAGAALLAGAYIETGRRAEVAETAQLYARDAYCLLKLARPEEAFLRLEQGKARLLAEALAVGDSDLASLSEGERDEVLRARRTLRELEGELRQAQSTSEREDARRLREQPRVPRRDERELTEDVRRARAELNALIDRLRTEHAGFMPQGLTLPELLALIPAGGAMVAPLLTSQGSAVFVLPHGTNSVTAEEVIAVDAFKDSDLSALLQGPADGGRLGGWLGAYAEFSTVTDRGERQRWCEQQWFGTLQADTGVLWQELMQPVHERLQALRVAPGAPVLVMPQGRLGLLPLHAAWREVEGRRRYFCEDYTVTYLPSGYALEIGRHRLQEPQRQKRSLLAVINPTKNLAFTDAEGEAVSALFPKAAKLLKEDEATIDAVRQTAAGHAYLHFSCHGYYDWQDPMQSGLLMANQAPLTLADVISKLDLSACRLVTLSACETGISEFRQSPDEFLGLPIGFLQAGAPGVVGTLWAVDDVSTMLLMARFYKHHLEDDMPPATALREAQLWLRNVTAGELRKRFSSERELIQSRARLPERVLSEKYQDFALKKDSERPFAHPYYWAAFTFIGV